MQHLIKHQGNTMEFLDTDGQLRKNDLCFPSPDKKISLLYKSEHELGMGGPSMGYIGFLLENGKVIKVDGMFSDKALWKSDGQHIALAKWAHTKGESPYQKVCVIDVRKRQISMFEESVFVQRFLRFDDHEIECQYYWKGNTKILAKKTQNLQFGNLETQDEN